jgi:hypothetical protein
MNCMDCSEDVTAVAVCGRCGAGLCRDHLVEREEQLVVLKPINRPVGVEPAARRLRCRRCDAAESAQSQTRGVPA